MSTANKPKPRRAHLLALAAGMAAAVPLAPAAGQAGDFSLPPGPGETPAVQGPVAEGIASPRPVGTEAVEAAPATPAPTPAASPSPTPAPAPTPSPSATASPGPARTAAPPAERLPLPSPTARPAAAQGPQPLPTPSPELAPPAAAEHADGGTAWLPWLAGLLAGFAALAGAWFWWRKREQTAARGPAIAVPVIAIPQIERPRVAPAPRAPARPAAAIPPREATPDASGQDGPLSLALEALQLGITLTATTLAYRITLTNTGAGPLSGITIAGDMISAHASLTREEQLASATSPLEQLHLIDRLRAGESAQVSGEMRLPLPRIRPIRNGDVALFVPLARLRVEAAEGTVGAIIQTVLVGQGSPRPGAGLQPFRLDLGPRIYREVTQRIFS